ncbi:flavin reductase family protein [Massilia putida]|uniref:flavin reductase family protein n=1 Tax=Massilia putida TaxID=1141883 RepID=UPI0012EB4BAF|nr:flavin reductase family protein [Massilia putida]
MECTSTPLPAIDRNEFRSALSLFPTGVAVVTAEGGAGEGRIGMTITSFNSVSLDPPLVLFSIGKQALSLPVLCGAKMYSVNVLGEDHQHISSRFATAKGDKWSGTEVEIHDGLPFTLKDSIVSFQAVPYAQHDGGDHVIFVGRVVRIHKKDPAAPLVFFGGKYAVLQPPATR